MKTRIISCLGAGYGHKKITIRYRDGKEYSAITNDMRTFDRYDTEGFTKEQISEQNKAKRTLINLVKFQNNLN